MKEEKKYILDLLKMIGMLLIINSHADIFFPERLRILATGGAIGNSIFFIISGYLTKIPHDNENWKRILFRFFRLYLPMYIVLILNIFTDKNPLARIQDFASAVDVLLWPTPYWFVSSFFVGFILLSVCRESWFENSAKYAVFSLVIFVVYLLCYCFGLSEKYKYIIEDGYLFETGIQFKCIYTFYIYTLGYYIRLSGKTVSGRKAVIITTSSLVLFYGFKYLLQIHTVSMQFQVITHAFVISFSYGILNLALAYEKEYIKVVRPWLRKIIGKLSMISLESYIVQMLLIPVIHQLPGLKFPFNYCFLQICPYEYFCIISIIIRWMIYSI